MSHSGAPGDSHVTGSLCVSPEGAEHLGNKGDPRVWFKRDLLAKPQVAASISNWLGLGAHHRIHGPQWRSMAQPAGQRGLAIHGGARAVPFHPFAARKCLFQQSTFSQEQLRDQKETKISPFEWHLPPSGEASEMVRIGIFTKINIFSRRFC